MKSLILFLAMAFSLLNAYAQLVPATVTENVYSNINSWSGWRHTINNDVRSNGLYNNFFSTTISDYKTVANGNRTGFFWNASGFVSGNIALDSGAIFPDITLMDDGTNIFVGIVYYKTAITPGTVGYYFVSGRHNGTTFTMAAPTLLEATTMTSGTNNPCIHIDADNQGRFAMAWSNSSSQVRVRPGRALAGVVNLGTQNAAGSVREPDVVVVNNGTTSAICIVGVNNTRSQFTVRSTTYAMPTLGSWTLEYTSPTKTSFSLPRISAPSIGNSKTFSVAVQRDFVESGVARQNIEMVYHNGTPTYRILNNGIDIVFTNLNVGENTTPVISYFGNNERLGVQWFCNAPAAGVNFDLIGIDFNLPALSLVNTAGYLEVNQGQACCSPLSSTADNDGYAISGRFSDWAKMSSFMDLNSILNLNNLTWKLNTWTNTSYKTLNNQDVINDEHDITTVYPTNFQTYLKIKAAQEVYYNLTITDISGRLVLTHRGTVDELNNHLMQLDNLNQGAYIVHLHNPELNISKSYKVFKQ